MRALKKYRGPGAGKKPVDRALLLVLEKMLRYDQDDDDLVLWASTLTAWHFMMRSAEYAAKRTGGKFDLDRVVRVCDVSFYYQGVMRSPHTALRHSRRSADHLWQTEVQSWRRRAGKFCC